MTLGPAVMTLWWVYNQTATAYSVDNNCGMCRKDIISSLSGEEEHEHEKVRMGSESTTMQCKPFLYTSSCVHEGFFP